MLLFAATRRYGCNTHLAESPRRAIAGDQVRLVNSPGDVALRGSPRTRPPAGCIRLNTCSVGAPHFPFIVLGIPLRQDLTERPQDDTAGFGRSLEGSPAQKALPEMAERAIAWYETRRGGPSRQGTSRAADIPARITISPVPEPPPGQRAHSRSIGLNWMPQLTVRAEELRCCKTLLDQTNQ